jgi:hypothetical protein
MYDHGEGSSVNFWNCGDNPRFAEIKFPLHACPLFSHIEAIDNTWCELVSFVVFSLRTGQDGTGRHTYLETNGNGVEV